ncbi:alpha/beta fold hydrolase [Compostibacter hankyongensis]|uniref:Alpha/beta fold hydrolase n=1 Tax=Compostibacter hankyongensis TaxID=1007089 RepID=A0ABP8G2A8_9BACT
MQLFFRRHGSGQPLIVLHGLFGSADNWNTLGKKWAEHFTVYLLDQRNHGHSPHSDTWNYKAMTEDLLELMDRERLPRAHVLGHSMGGKTAMFFATAHPDRTDKLIVADMAPRYYPVHHQAILEALTTLDLSAIHTRKEAEEWVFPKVGGAGTGLFLLKNLYRQDDGFAWRFNLPVIHDNIDAAGEALPAGARFEGEALFIRGGKSNYITAEDEQQIRKMFPAAKIVTLDTGHWVHAEQPAEFGRLVLEFLASPSAG